MAFVRKSSSARALLCTGLLIVVFSVPARALGLEPFILKGDLGEQSLGWYLEVLEDPEGKLTIDQVSASTFSKRFTKTKTEVPNFGFTDSAFWFRFEVLNRTGSRLSQLLEIAYPLLDSIELYVQAPDGAYTKIIAGDSYPYGNKVIRAFNFFFPITFEPDNPLRIYLRVWSGGALQVPLKLWTQESFVERAHRAQLAYGIYLGLLIFVFWYHLFILLSIRDRSYLLYILYILGTLFYQSSFEGVAQEYFWPNWPWWGNRALSFFCFATIIVAFLFTRVFLDLKRHLPRWNSVVSGYIVLGALGVLGSLLLSYRTMVIFLALVTVTGAVVIIAVGILTWRKGFRPARLYLAAWAAHMLGVAVLAFQKGGLVPKVALTEQGHLFGFALNAFILSFALANRITVLRREQDRALSKELDIRRQTALTLEQDMVEKTRELDQKTEEFSDAHDQLAEQDRLKTDLITNASHELRSPLTLALTSLEHLLEDRQRDLPSTARETIRSVSEQGRRLHLLVDRILDFSRFATGLEKVAYEHCDVRSLIEPVVATFEAVARGKGIQLSSSAPDDLPLVYTDPGWLDKVMCNLLSNACRFTAKGGAISVQLSGNDRSLTVQVESSGVGISQQELDRILEPSGTDDEDDSKRAFQRRTGEPLQGLRLCRRLVAAVGGKLEGHSEPGRGSTFTVILPLGRDHIVDPALIRLQADGEHPGDSADDGERRSTVSVIDGDLEDDPRSLMVVVDGREELRRRVADSCQRDFLVLEASDGQQALELIRTHKPAVVVASATTPRLSGYELMRSMRIDRATAKIPILLLREPLVGTYQLSEKRSAGPRKALEDADDYLRESFEPEQILAHALNLVRLRDQARELKNQDAEIQQEARRHADDLELASIVARSLPPRLVRSVIAESARRDEQQQRIEEHALTVFRMELRGFKQLTGLVETVEMTAMLNAYLSEVVDVAFAHGATVDRIIRDIIVGYFGAPQSQSAADDALRCVDMAEEIWQRVMIATSRWGDLYEQVVPPSPTMVLTSGKAMVGVMGASRCKAYTALGGAVEEAAELLPFVSRGEVVCSTSTWALIKDSVLARSKGSDAESIVGQPLQVGRQGRSLTTLYRLARPAPEPISEAQPSAMSEEPIAVDEKASATRWDMDDLAAGLVVDNRYRIIRQIGEKGRGTVYKARDMQVSRDVALKIIRLDARDDPHLLGKLHRRIRMARLVTHPRIAEINEVGEYHGYDCIAMRYLDGPTMERSRLSGQHIPLQEGLRVLWQLSAGLAAIHSVGIVHGFLSPSNVLLSNGGSPVILNLGCAGWDFHIRMAQGGGASVPFAASLLYMAPEWFDRRDPDPRADIYSLGAMVYELFTGQRPVEAKSIDEIRKIQDHETPRDPRAFNRNLPQPLIGIILRCLEKSPRDRFGSISELVTHLHVNDLVVERGER